MKQKATQLPVFSFLLGKFSTKEFRALDEVEQTRLFYQALCLVLLLVTVVLTLIIAHITAVNFAMPLGENIGKMFFPPS